MRILCFVGSLNTGGAERQFSLIADGLASRGHEVTLATIYPGGFNWAWLERRGTVEVTSLFEGRGQDLPRTFFQVARAASNLRRLISRTGADVVYSMLYLSNAIAWMATRAMRAPLVWGIRASEGELNWKRRVPFELGRWMSRTVPLAISNSRAGLEHHELNGFRPRARIVIPNGIDVDYFKRSEESRKKLRAAWGVHDDATLVGMVARLAPIKDHPSFLGAAAVLASAPDSKFRFVCVGDGREDYTARLQKLGRDLGLSNRLLWTGARADVSAVYSALDVAVLSSRGEGLANVVPEAMSTGTPCVVTDVGDLAWVVGDTGEVVPPEDPEALARGIQRLSQRLVREKALGAATRARVVEELSLDACITRTEAALLQLLAKR